MKSKTRIWGGILGAVLATASAVESPAAGWPASTGGKRGGLVELLSGPSQVYAENDAYRQAQRKNAAASASPQRAVRPDIIPPAQPRVGGLAHPRASAPGAAVSATQHANRSRREPTHESTAGPPGARVPFSSAVFGPASGEEISDPSQLGRSNAAVPGSIHPVDFENQWEMEQEFVAQSPNDLDTLVPPRVNNAVTTEQLPSGAAPPNTTSGRVPPAGPQFVPSPQDPNYYNASAVGRPANTLTALLGDDASEYQRQMREQQFCQQMWQCAGGRCLSWRDRVLRDWRRTYEVVYRGPSECQQSSLVSMLCEPVLYPRQHLGWVVGIGPIGGKCHTDPCTSPDTYWEGFCEQPEGCTTGVGGPFIRRPLIRRPLLAPRAVESSCTTESCTAPTAGAVGQSSLFHAPGLHGASAGCVSGNCGCATGACGS